MDLNWDAFLGADALNAPHEPWSDFTTLSALPPAPSMPKSLSTDTSGSTPDDSSAAAAAAAYMNGSSVDAYALDDALFISNDYFLDDVNLFSPAATTTTASTAKSITAASSPASLSTLNRSTSQLPMPLPAELSKLPEMQSSLRQAVQRADALTNPAYESVRLNDSEAGLVEDLTFSRPTTRPPASSASPSTTTRCATDAKTKRSKNRPDILSACWTSPLCPNHDQEGPPPNPSTCGAGCAPFLFASDDTLPAINNLLAETQIARNEDGEVEIQPRPNKRSESEASAAEALGRAFPSMDTGKHDAEDDESEASPAKDAALATNDPKPKSRRLPHNQVERKYRESLNTQLELLRRVVPALQKNQRPCDEADIEDLPVPAKPSKAVILASATAYIKTMEKDKKSLADENQMLRKRVKALQALVKCDDCSLMQYVMDLKVNQPK